MEPKCKFTQDALARLECPAGKKWILVSDAKTQGLKLRATKAGVKAFIYQRRLPASNENRGKLVEIVIGRFGDMRVEQARVKAQEYNVAVGKGFDPSIEPPHELTYGQLFDEHYMPKYSRPQTVKWKEQERVHKHDFQRWHNVPVSKIKRSEIQSWLETLMVPAKGGAETLDKSGQPKRKIHRSNFALAQMKAVINFGRSRDLIFCENPCFGIKKVPTKARERFIQPGDEFARFAKALAEEPHQIWHDFFWIALLVAARRSNIMAMRWEEINFTTETWTIPRTKNGDSLTVPLTPNALEILARRSKAVDRHPVWVFPSTKALKSGEYSHLQYAKEAWKRVLKRAQITDLRVHDLRRTAGSYLAIMGVSPTIIGKALGHRSQSATAVYARLTQDPVKQAMINAQVAMLNPEKFLKPASIDDESTRQENVRQ